MDASMPLFGVRPLPTGDHAFVEAVLGGFYAKTFSQVRVPYDILTLYITDGVNAITNQTGAKPSRTITEVERIYSSKKVRNRCRKPWRSKDGGMLRGFIVK